MEGRKRHVGVVESKPEGRAVAKLTTGANRLPQIRRGEEN